MHLLFVPHIVSVVSLQVSHSGYIHMVQAIPTIFKDYIQILFSWEVHMGKWGDYLPVYVLYFMLCNVHIGQGNIKFLFGQC